MAWFNKLGRSAIVTAFRLLNTTSLITFLLFLPYVRTGRLFSGSRPAFLEKIMSRYTRSLLAAAVLITAGVAAYAGEPATAGQQTTGKPFTGHQLAKNAKVSLADARAIALKARPGTITDEELEKEKGGSGLRYSFDIEHEKRKFEVGVDAMTGRVLENKLEGPNPD